MKKLTFIVLCILSVAYAETNFVLHSYAGNTALTKTEFEKSKKTVKKIIDFLQYNQYNNKDKYTKNISPKTREVFEKSVARQFKQKNKLNTFSISNLNDKKSIDNFTRDNVGVFINAFIEAVDFCIPTNKHTGLKDINSAEDSKSREVGDLQSISFELKANYAKECWEYLKPKIFTYDNNFNYRTNPAPIKIIQVMIAGNKFITKKVVNDEDFFNEFRKHYTYHRRKNQPTFGMKYSLEEAYKKKTTAELGLLLEEDWKHNFFDSSISLEISGRMTEEAYQLYEKDMKKEMASWNPKKESYKKSISSFKNMIKNQRKRVDKHLRFKKEAKKGKSEEQVFTDYTADLKKRQKELEKMTLNSEGKIKLYFAELKKCWELTDKYPKGQHYFSLGKGVKKIRENAKPEFKEVYWQFMNKKEENDYDRITAGSAGEAFGKVMTEEDLSRAFDYMNKQRSFKLIDLLTFYKDTPPQLSHKAASIAMLQQIINSDRTNLFEYFVKRHKKIKDPNIRRSFLESAPRYFGLTNYPEPFFP